MPLPSDAQITRRATRLRTGSLSQRRPATPRQRAWRDQWGKFWGNVGREIGRSIRESEKR